MRTIYDHDAISTRGQDYDTQELLNAMALVANPVS